MQMITWITYNYNVFDPQEYKIEFNKIHIDLQYFAAFSLLGWQINVWLVLGFRPQEHLKLFKIFYIP